MVIFARDFAYRLASPLSWIIQRIDKFSENNDKFISQDDDQIHVDEVKKVEAFIMKSISDLHYANQVKSTFLMNMSHDFRTPASGIQYMSRLIHDRISDPALKRLQKLVVNSSEQLMILLEDVLDYSRLENNKLETNSQHFDMNKLMIELIHVMSAKAEERGLFLITDFPQEVISCYGDLAILKRIFLNLLSNAIKFTHSGSVTISTGIKNGRISVSIKDTGIGIDFQYHSIIFEPFYRISSTDSAKYPGIGLGLSNVKLMLQKLDGEITLLSELGKGSEFIVVF